MDPLCDRTSLSFDVNYLDLWRKCSRGFGENVLGAAIFIQIINKLPLSCKDRKNINHQLAMTSPCHMLGRVADYGITFLVLQKCAWVNSAIVKMILNC